MRRRIIGSPCPANVARVLDTVHSLGASPIAGVHHSGGQVNPAVHPPHGLFRVDRLAPERPLPAVKRVLFDEVDQPDRRQHPDAKVPGRGLLPGPAYSSGRLNDRSLLHNEVASAVPQPLPVKARRGDRCGNVQALNRRARSNADRPPEAGDFRGRPSCIFIVRFHLVPAIRRDSVTGTVHRTGLSPTNGSTSRTSARREDAALARGENRPGSSTRIFVKVPARAPASYHPAAGRVANDPSPSHDVTAEVHERRHVSQLRHGSPAAARHASRSPAGRHPTPRGPHRVLGGGGLDPGASIGRGHRN